MQRLDGRTTAILLRFFQRAFLWTAVFVGSAALFAVLFHNRVSEPLAAIVSRGIANWIDLDPSFLRHPLTVAGALTGAILFTSFPMQLSRALFARRKAALYASARSFRSPAEGETIAIEGRLVARGPELRAPLSGRPCIAYQYEISSMSHEGADSRSEYYGAAATPAAIETTDGDTVKLLGFPLCFDEAPPLARDETVRNARAWVEATPFKVRRSGLSDLRAILADAGDVLEASETPLRIDVRNEPAESDLATCTFSEAIVEAGWQVCATGVWSSARAGLGPEAGVGDRGLLVERGTAEPLLRKYRRQSRHAVTRALVRAAILVLGLIALVPDVTKLVEGVTDR